jgi:hypothetical protein
MGRRLSDLDTEDAVRALQRGVRIPLPGVTGGGAAPTVREFARTVLKLEPEAFDREVKTIMLNNQVVDDPKAALLVDGDTLVLSGAMPGLVGAMLRSDSPIKALRAGLAAATDPKRGSTTGDGTITLKAFNTVLSNHMDDIIAFGAYVDG